MVDFKLYSEKVYFFKFQKKKILAIIDLACKIGPMTHNLSRLHIAWAAIMTEMSEILQSFAKKFSKKI